MKRVKLNALTEQDNKEHHSFKRKLREVLLEQEKREEKLEMEEDLNEQILGLGHRDHNFIER